MKKQRNCWLYGLTRSAAILIIVALPRLLTNGVAVDKAYIFTNLVALAVGTLMLGGIERYYRSEPDNK